MSVLYLSVLVLDIQMLSKLVSSHVSGELYVFMWFPKLCLPPPVILSTIFSEGLCWHSIHTSHDCCLGPFRVWKGDSWHWPISKFKVTRVKCWHNFKVFRTFSLQILHELHSNVPWLLLWTTYIREKDTADLTYFQGHRGQTLILGFGVLFHFTYCMDSI